MTEIDYKKITRLEVISQKGRELVRYDVSIDPHVQDEGRTLKIVVNNRKAEDTWEPKEKEWVYYKYWGEVLQVEECETEGLKDNYQLAVPEPIRIKHHWNINFLNTFKGEIEPTRKCPDCNGKGMEKFEYVDRVYDERLHCSGMQECKTCGGTGKIPKEVMDEKRYLDRGDYEQ